MCPITEMIGAPSAAFVSTPESIVVLTMIPLSTQVIFSFSSSFFYQLLFIIHYYYYFNFLYFCNYFRLRG